MEFINLPDVTSSQKGPFITSEVRRLGNFNLVLSVHCRSKSCIGTQQVSYFTTHFVGFQKYFEE